MKYSHLILLLFTTLSFSQAKLFDVEIIETQLPADGNGFNKLKSYTPYFYEDESYIVTSECRGEFGGQFHFQDKKDNTIYTGYAACPVIINKLDNNYYVTTSLAHMSGFWEFYEITNPRELTIKTSDTIYYSHYQLLGGIKVLAAGMGQTILLSFKHNSKIYHIVNDYRNNETYIAERKNALLVKVQDLIPTITYSFHENARVTKDGHYAASFVTPKEYGYSQGYIDVYNGGIKVYLYK